MAGLVGYDSSDEEEIAPQQESKSLKQTQDAAVVANREPSASTKPAIPSQKDAKDQLPSAPIIGPQINPSQTTGPSFPPLEEAPMDDEDLTTSPNLPPGSPYTATRTLIRDLTLPPLPNTTIPPSPPGSPPPATSAKFERFLELKKQGVHFNSKVAANPSMGNPALMDKLLAFVGLGAPGDQYCSTLGADVWDPVGFPRGAYKEQLRASQGEGEKARARGKGMAVEFVGASGLAEGEGGGGVVAKQSGGKRKTRFDA